MIFDQSGRGWPLLRDLDQLAVLQWQIRQVSEMDFFVLSFAGPAPNYLISLRLITLR